MADRTALRGFRKPSLMGWPVCRSAVNPELVRNGRDSATVQEPRRGLAGYSVFGRRGCVRRWNGVMAVAPRRLRLIRLRSGGIMPTWCYPLRLRRYVAER